MLLGKIISEPSSIKIERLLATTETDPNAVAD